jgi:hypothetical protein
VSLLPGRHEECSFTEHGDHALSSSLLGHVERRPSHRRTARADRGGSTAAVRRRERCLEPRGAARGCSVALREDDLRGIRPQGRAQDPLVDGPRQGHARQGPARSSRRSGSISTSRPTAARSLACATSLARLKGPASSRAPSRPRSRSSRASTGGSDAAKTGNTLATGVHHVPRLHCTGRRHALACSRSSA